MEGWRQQAMASIKLNHRPGVQMDIPHHAARRKSPMKANSSLTPTGLLMEGLISLRQGPEPTAGHDSDTSDWAPVPASRAR
jgi:hypothetical protein